MYTAGRVKNVNVLNTLVYASAKRTLLESYTNTHIRNHAYVLNNNA